MPGKPSSRGGSKGTKKGVKSGPTQTADLQSGPRPIEHVIVLMLENRSFDHIFGYREGVNGLKGTESNLLDPTKPESQTNPSFVVNNGAPYAVLAGQGPGHSINAANVQLCDNKLGPAPANPAANNGFVNSYHTELVFADKVKNPSDAVVHVAMQSFAPVRLPSINALADAFCVCDNWYSEVPGPTQPNRLYVHAATSFGYAHNVWTQQFDGPTIYNRLDGAGHTWAIYWFDDNDVGEFTQVKNQATNFKLFDQSFVADVKGGNLPTYTFIEPRFMNAKTGGGLANSQHAPQDARNGDNFVADVYETLRSNEALWNKSVLIVTYDEHGGFYDHVIPPSDGIPESRRDQFSTGWRQSLLRSGIQVRPPRIPSSSGYRVTLDQGGQGRLNSLSAHVDPGHLKKDLWSLGLPYEKRCQRPHVRAPLHGAQRAPNRYADETSPNPAYQGLLSTGRAGTSGESPFGSDPTIHSAAGL